MIVFSIVIVVLSVFGLVIVVLLYWKMAAILENGFSDIVQVCL